VSTDLKGELASLRIDRTRKAGSRWRWPLVVFVPVVLGLAVLYGLCIRQTLATQVVETTEAAVTIREAGTEVSGAPILTASGYVVARRKAVVSAKIQGRLSWLGVEEGSQVGYGEIIARSRKQRLRSIRTACEGGRLAGRGRSRREPAPAPGGGSAGAGRGCSEQISVTRRRPGSRSRKRNSPRANADLALAKPSSPIHGSERRSRDRGQEDGGGR